MVFPTKNSLSGQECSGWAPDRSWRVSSDASTDSTGWSTGRYRRSRSTVGGRSPPTSQGDLNRVVRVMQGWSGSRARAGQRLLASKRLRRFFPRRAIFDRSGRNRPSPRHREGDRLDWTLAEAESGEAGPVREVIDSATLTRNPCKIRQRGSIPIRLIAASGGVARGADRQASRNTAGAVSRH